MKKYIFSFLLFLITNFAFGQFNDNTPDGTETWIAPAGVTSVVVEVWGAGGGGASSSGNPNAGGGGSGGGYVRAVYTVVPGNSYTYRVGYGGDASYHGQSSYFINATTINAVGGRSATSTAGATAPSTGNYPLVGYTLSTYGGNGGNAPSNTISGGGGSSAGFTNGNNAVGRYGGYAPVYGYDGANGVDAHNNGINGRIGAGGSGGSRSVSGWWNERTGGGGGSGQIRISYCASGAPSFTGGISTRDDLYISKFQFVGMLNDNLYVPVNSTYVASGYQNHTIVTEKAKQPQGSVMNVEAYASASSVLNFGRWRAWVDWNKDGDFFDIGEEVYSMVNYYTPSVTFGFAISSTQAVGTYKLRISNVKVSGYGEYFGPCQVSTNLGEVEDHIFEVVADCSAKVTSVNSENTYDGERCGAGSVRLSATGNASAVSFRWYANETGGTPLPNANASSANFDTPIITPTDPSKSYYATYYVTAVSSDGCETAYRYPVVARIDPQPKVTFSSNKPSICGEDRINDTGRNPKYGVNTTNNTASIAATADLQTYVGYYSSLTGFIDNIYGSDYMPFEKNGETVIGLYERPTNNGTVVSNPYYHNNTDTIANLSYPYIYQVTKATVGAVQHFAIADTGTLAVNDVNKAKDFAVYPNPVKDVLHLQLDSSIKDFTFEVTDLNGRKILSIKNQKDVNVSSLKSGVYIGTLISEMGKDSKKIIIE